MDDAGPRQPQPVEVALDRADRVGIALDEDGARGAPRERLDPERAGAGEEIEHARVLERPHEVEDVLAHAVGRRPRVEAARRAQLVTLAAAGDDPHERSLERAVARRHGRNLVRLPSVSSVDGACVLGDVDRSAVDTQAARRRSSTWRWVSR